MAACLPIPVSNFTRLTQDLVTLGAALESATDLAVVEITLNTHPIHIYLQPMLFQTELVWCVSPYSQTRRRQSKAKPLGSNRIVVTNTYVAHLHPFSTSERDISVLVAVWAVGHDA